MPLHFSGPKPEILRTVLSYIHPQDLYALRYVDRSMYACVTNYLIKQTFRNPEVKSFPFANRLTGLKEWRKSNPEMVEIIKDALSATKFRELKRIWKLSRSSMTDQELTDQTMALMENAEEDKEGGLWKLLSESVGWASAEENGLEADNHTTNTAEAGRGVGIGDDKSLSDLMREWGEEEEEEQRLETAAPEAEAGDSTAWELDESDNEANGVKRRGVVKRV